MYLSSIQVSALLCIAGAASGCGLAEERRALVAGSGRRPEERGVRDGDLGRSAEDTGGLPSIAVPWPRDACSPGAAVEGLKMGTCLFGRSLGSCYGDDCALWLWLASRFGQYFLFKNFT